MKFFPQALIALAAAATAALAVPMERRAPFPDPNDDPFYQMPSNIGTYANGQVIQSRKAPTDIGNINKAESFQLSYRTTNTQKEASVTVATVWIPSKPASPPKIFSYQTYEDSAQLNCAPSYNYLTGIDQPNKVTTILDTPIIISWALQQGYYVVSSDHEGPGSAFIAGYEEGMAVLDGIRAFKNFKNLPQDIGVGLYGYSGGAHATAWAVNLAEGYAPEIKIDGAAYGGTPASAKEMLTFLNKGFFSGFVVAGVSGLARAHPDLEAYLQTRLTAKGKQALQQVRSRGFCAPSVVLNNNFLDIFSLVSDTNILAKEPVSGVLKQETLVQAEASYTVPVPKIPRFMWHALPDEIVPFQPAAAYVKEQCQKGANINWNVYPIAEHATAEIFGLVPGLHFLKQAFQGKTPKVVCGSDVPAITGINSPSAQTVLGSDLANKLNSLKGQQSVFGKQFSSHSPPLA
ncbi:probable lipase precursor [Ustilago trichophora]|uniref:Lipase n=1 Tax=Ustilago trichophora TaxID=86804 RepID=A0A5C3EQP3_9BASI|nr:probable lipase precursor [Ustilago trichophora]